jgi:hypothetical protein
VVVERFAEYVPVQGRCVPRGDVDSQWLRDGMKVHAYIVQPRGAVPMDATLQHIAGLGLEARLKNVNNGGMRLEYAAKVGHFWLLDFTLIRREGPGKAAPNAPIEDFVLQDAEGFGQETAAYFDTASGFMTMQYNHYGPRMSRVQSYLSRFARIVAGQPDNEYVLDGTPAEGFNITPVLKAEAATRLDQMGIVKNIEFSFHVPGVSAREAGTRQSLSSFLDAPLVGGAETIRVQIAAGRKKASSLILNDVKAAVTDLLGLKDDVTELSIVAKETEDGPSEPVDFLEARLEADIPLTLGAGRRYARDSRIAALKQSFDAWRANGLLA